MRRIPKLNSEENLHLQATDYLRRQYPGVIFRTDFAAGIKMTMGQAIKHASLQESKSYPDLFIAKPTKGYSGLFLELKKDGVKLIRDKDARAILKGETKLRKAGDWFNDHIESQAFMLLRLGQAGYYCTFAVGFDDAKQVIDWYLREGASVGVQQESSTRF